MPSDAGIKVLNPTIEPDTDKSSMAIRPESLDGVTVGLLANGKRNSAELLRHVYDVLKETNDITLGVEENKGNASRPCPGDLLSNVADSCDVVITASGDWGSCSSCSVHDGIQFEKQGVPTAVICTEPFITSGVAMAKIGGIPNYPFAVTDHPLGSLDQETLKEKAREITPRILEILVQGI